MKLVTFQSLEALKDLINKGYLECNEKYINLHKTGPTYAWILEKMMFSYSITVKSGGLILNN